MKIPDPSEDWAQRGFSCAIWVDPPGQVWCDFVHATDELVMPVEGEIELEIGGMKCYPRIGEEVVIPAGVRHTVRNVGNCVSRWYYGYRQGRGIRG
jgi:mannose-6-phosphate isomerase-like protein (cupin superfamily)